MDPDELTLLILAKYCAAIPAGWEECNAKLVASTHIMAALLGGLEVEIRARP